MQFHARLHPNRLDERPVKLAAINVILVTMKLQQVNWHRRQNFPYELRLGVDEETDDRHKWRHELRQSRRLFCGYKTRTVRIKHQPDRIGTEGKGADTPIAPNSTADGRAQNRRVEILIQRQS